MSCAECVALLCLGLVQPSSAQVIRGRTVDDVTDAPVPGVLLIVARGDTAEGHAVSDEEGAFAFTLPGFAAYTIRAIRLGYGEVVLPAVTLRPEQPEIDFDLLLTPKPLVLEGLTVEAPRYQSDVEELGLRLEDLGRRIVTREHLDGMGFRDVGAALERQAIPGIAVTRGENLSAMENGTLLAARIPFCVRLARARQFDGTQRCALVVLDQAFATSEAVDALAPDDLEAIVVLTPTEAVQRFGPVGGWGAVLLYTRRGR